MREDNTSGVKDCLYLFCLEQERIFLFFLLVCFTFFFGHDVLAAAVSLCL